MDLNFLGSRPVQVGLRRLDLATCIQVASGQTRGHPNMMPEHSWPLHWRHMSVQCRERVLVGPVKCVVCALGNMCSGSVNVRFIE